MGVYLNQGSGNPGWDALLDKVNLGGDVTYNFERPAPVVDPAVLPAASPAAATPSLAETGVESTPVLVGGAALLAFGAALFGVAAWRRKTSHR